MCQHPFPFANRKHREVKDKSRVHTVQAMCPVRCQKEDELRHAQAPCDCFAYPKEWTDGIVGNNLTQGQEVFGKVLRLHK